MFVDRINITGNTRTEDEVIRREFRIDEGDAFNAAKIRASPPQRRKSELFQ